MDKMKQARSEIDLIDREMAALFCRRMNAVIQIAAYKKANNIPVSDPRREAEILSRNADYVDNDLRAMYEQFQRCVMDIGKSYQHSLNDDNKSIHLELGAHSYDVIIERGCIRRAGKLLDLARQVMIVTDDGVPSSFARLLSEQCTESRIFTVPQGETSKSFDTLRELLAHMTSFGMMRSGCVVAVGGGMVGDLAGLAASLYMRGVDYYNIPTTLLAQVDASVGGKTAVDFAGFKNTVGAFYQPRRVLLDPDVLSTLPRRQLSSGLAESLKMAATLDPELFAVFEQEDPISHLDEIIRRSVACKARIVCADERESGLRRVLNFGHTIGHAIESSHQPLLHGECVALGMLPMCTEDVRDRMLPIYAKLSLPTTCELKPNEIAEYLIHDKKRVGSELLAIEAPEIGRYNVRPMTIEELTGRLSCITRGADTE